MILLISINVQSTSTQSEDFEYVAFICRLVYLEVRVKIKTKKEREGK